MFGPGLVVHLANSMVEPLARAGYLRREVGGPEGSLYIYESKVNEIPLSASVSRAEEDIQAIIFALREYMSETQTLKPIVKADTELTTDFIDWITKADAPFSAGTIEHQERPIAVRDVGTSDQQIELLFSSFVSWAAKDRPPLFEKIKLFAELGLVMDLLSEMRVPTIRRTRVDLAVVLDSTVLLELLGLCGPMLQSAAARLMEMCKQYKVSVCTLTHLVDEVNEICYNVINNPSEGFSGSVSDAVRRYSGVIDLVRKVNKSPDTCIKALGVAVIPYTNIKDANSMRLFDGEDIRVFTAYLGYDQSKPMMAKRDAWSLAYAVRRQNSVHTSNLYES